ncbi:MAG: DUF1573 domain-containing protein [Chitinophagales bacterium]
MRHFFTFLFLAVTFFTFAQDGVAVIVFEEETHDFGVLPEGPKVTHEFEFKNTGDSPLVLSNVKASCGCTVPEWPKEPIQAGETATIIVTYNTARRAGNFTKSITITSNAQEASKIIYIKGRVEAMPEEETMPVKEPLMMAPVTE